MSHETKKTWLTNFDQIMEATKILYESGMIRRTPLLSGCENFSQRTKDTKGKFYFKLENLQLEGSFKTRGVIHRLLDAQKLKENNKSMVTMSGGNFARSFAFACNHFGIDAHIFMPETVPKDRIQICQEKFGAKVELVPVHCLESSVQEFISNHPNFTYAHPFDDPLLIQAYGSIGIEVFEDLKAIEDLNGKEYICVIGIGGGGLISGVATALKHLIKNIKIIGVEASNSPSMYLSRKKNRPVVLAEEKEDYQFQPTIMSGLAPPYAGTVTFEHVKQYVDDIVLVTETEVKQAMHTLYYDYHLVVEPSGAASLAACYKMDIANKHVICILSGGNIPHTDLVSVLSPPPPSPSPLPV